MNKNPQYRKGSVTEKKGKPIKMDLPFGNTQQHKYALLMRHAGFVEALGNLNAVAKVPWPHY